MIADRDGASGVLAPYRLAEVQGLPAPEKSVVVLAEDYAIVDVDGWISRIEIEGDVPKIIRENGEEYCVFSEDGTRSFGCFPTMREAEERLRQIHSFERAEGDCVRLPGGRVGRGADLPALVSRR